MLQGIICDTSENKNNTPLDTTMECKISDSAFIFYGAFKEIR
jgi:hypothetical protein